MPMDFKKSKTSKNTDQTRGSFFASIYSQMYSGFMTGGVELNRGVEVDHGELNYDTARNECLGKAQISNMFSWIF